MSMDRKLRSAARHAYLIRADGSLLGDGSEVGPALGYLAPPVCALAGDADIDAAFVARIPEGVVISIRGTTDPKKVGETPQQVLLDWAQNTGALLVNPGGAPAEFPSKVHFGFYQSYSRLWHKLWPAVKAAIEAPGPRAIFVTGHSKGGAICPLIAWRLQLHYRETHQITVRTFGAARSVDPAFALAYRPAVPDHIRYEYHDDIVPHLPVQVALLGALGAPPGVLAFLSMIDTGYGAIGDLQYIAKDGSLTPPPADRLAALEAMALADPEYILDCHGINLAEHGYVKANYP